MKFTASKKSFTILLEREDNNNQVFPLIRDKKGTELMECISPIHGRSFVVGRTNNGRYIVSKGNGLSYSTNKFSKIGKEQGEDLWGAISRENAERDFLIGTEVESVGIRCNHMEYVLELHDTISVDNVQVTPYLLQYDVQCPYRISDAPFIPNKILKESIDSWENLNENGFKEKHLIAAYVLIKNLSTLRKHHIMHNALHSQNYTWALELLDFEASRSDKCPYLNPDYEACANKLSEVEAIQTYEVINYIAWCLHESIDYYEIDKIFKSYNINI